MTALLEPGGKDLKQALWDPVTKSVSTLPNPGYDLFCAGHGQLPDGKILVPTRETDAPQLELLAERAAANRVTVERLNSESLARLEPEARSATGEALFVPGTSVVDPGGVMASLVEDSVEAGIELRCGGALGQVEADKRQLEWLGERVF